MLNPRTSESQAAAPAELIGSAQEYSRRGELVASNQHTFQFIVGNQSLEQCSFEQLGLTAFDPESLDWWSENESA